jgi:hypothetical protein
MASMNKRQFGLCLALLAGLGCGEDNNVQPAVPTTIAESSGADQSGQVNTALADSLSVLVTDNSGSPMSGIAVSWSIVSGGGTVSPGASSTNSSGIASTQFTLGPSEGQQQAEATISGLTGSPVIFTAIASTSPGGGPGQIVLSVAAGGNNVPDRYSSDLWVHGNYAYTGTWGGQFRTDKPGNVLNVWALDGTGAPSLTGTVTVPGIITVSDDQVSDDGSLLVLSGEFGLHDGGIYVYGLTDPAHPSLLGSANVGGRGIHTVTLSTINGKLYAFAAMNPGYSGDETEDMPALMIYDLTNPSAPTLVHREPILPDYGIHDTYVRDGLAFVFAWNQGVIIYDVGNGMRGGSPTAPVKISQFITAKNGGISPEVHNGWWFHNAVTGEKRYLFVGQEEVRLIGVSSFGDIHVLDVSDLAHPSEVAFFHLKGAGTHNFWVDESRQVLYAAYYNAGVVALDISGTLSGDLSSRLLSQIRPGGSRNTFTWGVQLANGSLYAIDMLSGFWQLKTE